LFFDAEWVSVGCQSNSFIEARDSLPRQAQTLGIAPLRIDLTGANAAGMALLARYGIATVPSFVVVDSEGRAVSISGRPEVTAERLPALASVPVR